MAPRRPTQPDLEFAKRFAKSSRYAFYMRRDAGPDGVEDIQQIDSERFVVLDLNPQQISMREPKATAIRMTQGGGKIVEKRGNLLKPMTISGTTGWTPLPEGHSLHASIGRATDRIVSPSGALRRGSLVPLNVAQLDTVLAQRSGFWAFHRLRHLFRLYDWYAEQGDTTYTFNYIDTKNDEYWRIEPSDFVLQRSSKKPFAYDYQINFQCIELSTSTSRSLDEISLAFLGLSNTSVTDPSVLQTVRRLDELHGSGLDYLKHISGKAQIAFQGTLAKVNAVVGHIEDVDDGIRTIGNTALVLLSQLDNSLSGMADVIGQLAEDIAAGKQFILDGSMIGDLNEWHVETRKLTDFLLNDLSRIAGTTWNSGIGTIVTAFSAGAGKLGTATSLMRTTEGAIGSPDADPYLGRSGLGLVTNMKKLTSLTSTAIVTVNYGENIFSFAQRVLGDAQRFVDIVLINNLSAPYIVANGVTKPSGTVAWGETLTVPAVDSDSLVNPGSTTDTTSSFSSTVTSTGTSFEVIDTRAIDDGLPGWSIDQWIGFTVTITVGGISESRLVTSNTASALITNLPWTTAPDVGDEYSIDLVLFDARRPRTSADRVFGTDLLLRWQPAAGGSSSNLLADIVINASRDLALARGEDNYLQAMNIRMRTEQGMLLMHPSFGVQMPVGRPWSEDIAILYIFNAKQSLLEDPRTAEVTNTAITLEGSAYTFSATVRPVNVKNSRPVSVTVP
jgi:hypothetical protein